MGDAAERRRSVLMSESEERARAIARLGMDLGGVWTLEEIVDVSDLTTTFAATHVDGSQAWIVMLHAHFVGDDEMHEHFLRHGYAANHVEHRGVVRVLADDVSEAGEPFLVLESLVGQTAAELALTRGPRLPWPVALSIAEQGADVLAALHEAGIVHRALDPSKLFVTREGIVKVLDAGGARLRAAASQSARAPWGKPHFMAPEVATSGEVDARADVFSLGAILFALIAGEPPRRGRTDFDALALAVSRPPPSLGTVVADVDEAVVELVDRALAWHPDDRYGSAAELRAATQAVLAGTQAAAAPEPAASNAAELYDDEYDTHDAGWDEPEVDEGARPAFVHDEAQADDQGPPTLDAPIPAPPLASPAPAAEIDRWSRISEPDAAAPEPLVEAAPKPTSGATAEGLLADTPLAHLFVYMLDRELSGSVVLRAPDGVMHALKFDRGVSVKVRTGQPIAPLDTLLSEVGLVDAATLRDSLATSSATKQLHGRVLVARGALDQATLLEVLRVQASRKLAALFELPDATRFTYYADRDVLERYGGPEPLPVDPWAVVAEGMRRRNEAPIIDATLHHFGGTPLRLVESVDPARLTLDPHERVVADTLRARSATVADLLELPGIVPDAVRRALYVLAILRGLDTGAPAREPVGLARTVAPLADLRSLARSRRVTAAQTPSPPKVAPPKPPPPPRAAPPVAPPLAPKAAPKPGVAASSPTPPPVASKSLPPPARASTPPLGARRASTSQFPAGGLTPNPSRAMAGTGSSRRTEVERRLETAHTEDFFALLGVARSSTKDQIQTAYFTAARTFHPDRLPPELSDLKPAVSRAFARINDAYQTLNDPDRRKAYEASLSRGMSEADEQEQVARAMTAANDFQKAEVYLRRNDLAGAEALVSKALLNDPEQPEYVAFATWVQALKLPDPPLAAGATSTHLEELIQTLDKILAKEPRFERALFYRAMLQKRSGHADKAYRDFRMVLEQNPKHIDAQREVRLHEMRRKNDKGEARKPTPMPGPVKPTGGGGLLGRFIKR
jgi:DnaJ-domain-containing protein 1